MLGIWSKPIWEHEVAGSNPVAPSIKKLIGTGTYEVPAPFLMLVKILEKNMPVGLHHLEIYVSNLEHSKKFWKWFLELLGYEEFQSWDEGISWKLEDAYLRQSSKLRSAPSADMFSLKANALQKIFFKVFKI